MNPFDDEETVQPSSEKAGGSWYARFRAKISRAMTHVSLRSRITGLVMVAVGVSVALASVAAWVTVRNQILHQLDDGLQTRATSVANVFRSTPGAALVSVAFLNANDLQMQIVDNNGTLDPRLPPLPVSGDDTAVASSGTGFHYSTIRTEDGTTLRAIAVPLGNHQALILAESMGSTHDTLGRLGLVSILVGIAGIAMAGSAGIAIGRAGLRPVDRLTEATEYVAKTGDLRPIEVQGTDELARLAVSFNAMLSALARSQDHQRRLIADAGHELRTPLTSMRTNVDLLAQIYRPGNEAKISNEDRDELIADVRAQMEELSVLVGDLVELSRDVKPQADPEPVNLADVVQQAIDRVRLRAPNVEFDLQTEPWFLRGDPPTLERAVTNLLDNAAKWSPEGGKVTVQLHDGLLQVSDEGPGIAEADLPHVFERFYRSDEARTMPGSGLGLAIVRQAAENHGGRVAAARAPGGGALLGLWLPGSPSDQPAADATVTAPA